jgi:hypothetical protein
MRQIRFGVLFLSVFLVGHFYGPTGLGLLTLGMVVGVFGIISMGAEYVKEKRNRGGDTD